MKRTISVLLVALLLALSAFALVACGGVSGTDDWNQGIDAYKNADAVTIKIHDKNLNREFIHNKERLVSDLEVAYDANKGIAVVTMKVTASDLVDLDPARSNSTTYYVLDGTNIIVNKKSNTYENWSDTRTLTFDSVEEAKTYMRDLYLHPCDIDEEEFPSFLELEYRGGNTTSTSNPRETKVNMFKNKYTQIFIDDESGTKFTYKLSFANGKPSKFTYKMNEGVWHIVIRDFSMSIKYSAKITLPDDLPKA